MYKRLLHSDKFGNFCLLFCFAIIQTKVVAWVEKLAMDKTKRNGYVSKHLLSVEIDMVYKKAAEEG